jgi:hypothetical protein
MDDYDAGFIDAVKLIKGKLDVIIEEQALSCKEDEDQQRDLLFLELIKQKLFNE